MTQPNYSVRLGRFLIRYPKSVLATVLVLVALLMTQMPQLRMDTSAESFLAGGAKVLDDYDDFRREFGRDEFFVVVITGVDVFSVDFLTALRDFHEAVEMKVDKLQSVESLVNVRSIYGEDDDLIAEDLLENFTGTEEDVDVIRQRIRGKDLYYGRLINHEEDTVAVMVKLIPYSITKNPDGSETVINLSDAEIAHGSDQLNAVVNEFRQRFDGANVHIGGTPELGSYMSLVVRNDLTNFTGAAVGVIGLMLAFMFRRASGVLIPMSIMALAISSTIAFMPLLGYPMLLTSSIMPSFLMAACIGAAVHLLAMFYRRYDAGATKEEALVYAFSHTGKPVFFTSMTTTVGVASFAFSEVQPIFTLGLFSAIGTMLALILSLTLVPVLVMLAPVKRKAVRNTDNLKEGGLPYRITRGSIYLSTHYPKSIAFVGVVLALVSLSFMPQIKFSQDSMKWLPDDNPVKVSMQVTEKKITGSMPLEIVIETGKEQGAIDPVLLQKLDRWVDSIEGKTIEGVKIISVNSLINLVKETHQAFNGNKASAYVIPDDQEAIAQELLLVEMDQADDLYQYTDRKFSKLRITLILPWTDAVDLEDFQEVLAADYKKAIGDGYDMHFTGLIPIFATMMDKMLESAAESYFLSALGISLLMIILMRGVVDGMLSMLPNFLPIIMVLAYMAINNIAIDVFSILIGSIAMGICVDDTVHFMHGFRTRYAEHGDAARAIDETLMSCGKALMITSVVLFWSFMAYTLSDLSSMDNFGILMAMCIVLAIIADFLLAPALMMLRYGKKKPVAEVAAE